MDKSKKLAEPLGPVKINNGQHAATLTRDTKLIAALSFRA
jgi:hypothetical protein